MQDIVLSNVAESTFVGIRLGTYQRLLTINNRMNVHTDVQQQSQDWQHCVSRVKRRILYLVSLKHIADCHNHAN